MADFKKNIYVEFLNSIWEWYKFFRNNDQNSWKRHKVNKVHNLDVYSCNVILNIKTEDPISNSMDMKYLFFNVN